VVVKRNVLCSARLVIIVPVTVPRRRAPRARMVRGQDFHRPVSARPARWVTIALEALLLRHAQPVLTEPRLP
jgi:hypothetical protein